MTVFSAADQTARPDRAAVRRKVSGLLLLVKPPGLTSNRALQRVRRVFGAQKAGHTGSLDPLASGMLPLCLGEATKFAGYLLEADKIYRVRARFGVRTDTADAEGRPIAEGRAQIAREELAEILARFRGPLMQIPPMFSALKRDGRPLYELARAGREVARAPRAVQVSELTLEHYDASRPVLRVRCSKGTYIRTLIEDLAAAAGTVAHVVELRRLAVLPFDEPAMVTIGVLEEAARAGPVALDRLLRPVDQMVTRLPELRLSATASAHLRQGRTVTGSRADLHGAVRLYDADGSFLGVGEVLPDGRVAPRRLVVLSPPQFGGGVTE
jgi:tRNA pseudouridine55 synthase